MCILYFLPTDRWNIYEENSLRMKSADVYLGVAASNKSSYCTNVSVTVIKKEFLQITHDAYKYGNF